MELDNRTYTLLQLRDYLAKLYEFRNPDDNKWNFNKIMGRIIKGKYTEEYDIYKNACEIQFGEKLIERFVSKQPHKKNDYLEKNEAEIIAEYLEDNKFKKKYNLYDKSGILQLLIKEFLKAHSDSDSTIPARYKNLPEQHDTQDIIQEETKNDLNKQLWDLGNFIFLQGFHGAGKNFIARTKAHELYNEEEVNYAFYIDCKNNKINSLEDFYRKILFFMDREEFLSVTSAELKKRSLEFLSKNNSIIYIEDFESIKDTETQKDIIGFLLKYKQLKKCCNLYVIITSNKRIESFPFKQKKDFSKIDSKPFTKSNLKDYYNYLIQDQEIKNALNLCTDAQKKTLENFVISKSTDLSFLKRSLFHIAKRINKNEVIEEVISSFFRKDIYKIKTTVYNYLEELSDDSRFILIALLYFKQELTKESLEKITYIKEPALTDAINDCYNRFFINKTTQKGKVFYSIAKGIKPLVVLDSEKNLDKYHDIRTAFIGAYCFNSIL